MVTAEEKSKQACPSPTQRHWPRARALFRLGKAACPTSITSRFPVIIWPAMRGRSPPTFDLASFLPRRPTFALPSFLLAYALTVLRAEKHRNLVWS